MVLCKKYSDMPFYQKFIVGTACILIMFFLIREMVFWSVFKGVMAEVKAQNAQAQKRTQEMINKANDMQKQMNEKVKQFQASADQQTSNMQKTADDISDSALLAEKNANQDVGKGMKEMQDEMEEDAVLQSEQEDIRRDVSNGDPAKKSMDFTPVEIGMIKAMIAHYRKTHLTILKAPNDSKTLILSPEDRIALLQMLRDYNHVEKEKEEEAAPSLADANKNIAKDFEKARRDFNKSFAEGLEEFRKNDEAMRKDFNADHD